MEDIQVKNNVIEMGTAFKKNVDKKDAAKSVLEILANSSQETRQYVLYEIGDYYCWDCGGELGENDYHEC